MKFQRFISKKTSTQLLRLEKLQDVDVPLSLRSVNNRLKWDKVPPFHQSSSQHKWTHGCTRRHRTSHTCCISRGWIPVDFTQPITGEVFCHVRKPPSTGLRPTYAHTYAEACIVLLDYSFCLQTISLKTQIWALCSNSGCMRCNLTTAIQIVTARSTD